MKMFKCLTIALTIVLGGCKTEINKNILVMGDSLAQQCVGTLGFYLLTDADRGYFVMDNAIGGSTFSQPDMTGTLYWHDRLVAILTQHPVTEIVISLGTNDATKNIDPLTAVTPANMALAVDRIMSATNNTPVYWILPNNRIAATAPTTISDVRAAITTAQGRWSNLHVLSFDWYIGAQGIGIDSISLPYPDAHFTNDGIAQWSAMVTSQLRAL